MTPFRPSRRSLIAGAACGAAAASLSAPKSRDAHAAESPATRSADGDQRLSRQKLQAWESLEYGMFIHFGMSTFVGQDIPDGKAGPEGYAPDRLDVDQWVSVARDAGMRYAVLTAKHVAGHCLWPSRHTPNTVANSPDRTDVCERFVQACRKRGVRPGFYYCSWDNRNRFHSRTPSDPQTTFLWGQDDLAAVQAALEGSPDAPVPAFTTSLYQSFQTAQITELLTRYGPVFEVWIDIPGILGRGYREYLYRRIAELQPDIYIMMNSGSDNPYPVSYAWPADLMSIEKDLPPGTGHPQWHEIEGRRYYIPGEVCETIGHKWFWAADDPPRGDDVLATMYRDCRRRNVNLLLNVPPDRHGVIPDDHVQALMRLRKNVGL